MSEAAFQAAVDKGMFAGLAMPPIVVQLSWPAKELSPNTTTIHWATKGRAVKAARTAAFYATRAVTTIKPTWKGARVSLTFNPPDKRRRDLQNCIASAKALVDGIADALGIDDSKFDCRYVLGEPVKGGAVRVEIRPI
jgi:crossover junction endodeoxyribonuclease RusA